MTTNILVCDLDLAEPNAADGRRLEVVADGLLLFGGAQLAIDTTLVSTLHANVLPRRAGVDGVALASSETSQRAEIPGTRETFWSGQVGCACRGSVWPLVEGDSVFLELIGPREGTF